MLSFDVSCVMTWMALFSKESVNSLSGSLSDSSTIMETALRLERRVWMDSLREFFIRSLNKLTDFFAGRLILTIDEIIKEADFLLLWLAFDNRATPIASNFACTSFESECQQAS